MPTREEVLNTIKRLDGEISKYRRLVEVVQTKRQSILDA